jgi:hypothetical protein
MRQAALRCSMTWTEDRALLRSNPSAAPGAETEARAPFFTDGARSSSLRDRPECVKPRGTMPRLASQDALHHSLTPTDRNSSSR